MESIKFNLDEEINNSLNNEVKALRAENSSYKSRIEALTETIKAQEAYINHIDNASRYLRTNRVNSYISTDEYGDDYIKMEKLPKLLVDYTEFLFKSVGI